MFKNHIMQSKITSDSPLTVFLISEDWTGITDFESWNSDRVPRNWGKTSNRVVTTPGYLWNISLLKRKIHVTCPHFLRHFLPASIANSMQWEGVEALLHDCDENHVAIVYYSFPDSPSGCTDEEPEMDWNEGWTQKFPGGIPALTRLNELQHAYVRAKKTCMDGLD